MKVRPLLATGMALLWLVGCGGSSSVDRSTPQTPATNPDGNPTTQVMEAVFSPATGQLPFPTNLLLSGSADLTLNVPVDDPTDFGDPAVALSQLDGFSTVTPWTFSFSQQIDPASVRHGDTVRLFEVEFVFGTIAVAGINRELTPGVDYIATVAPTDPTGRTVAIVPLRPLQQMTGYMAVVTNGIQDTIGTAATPSQTYFLTKRTSPLVDASGNSTDSLLDNGTARALEPLRQLTNAQEFAAASQGISRDDIVLSFTATTQSITPVLNVIRSQAEPTATQVAQACVAPGACLTTADVLPPGASPGIADLYIGVTSVPYYLGVPTAENPIAPINQFWQAAPGAYVPPFDELPLDPTSTAVTVANPMPVARSNEFVPVLMTVPNANSGFTRPEAGWPVVIFQHGITGNRTNMLAIADTMASIGFAVIAIDQPLHGITDTTSPLYVGNTPFGTVGRERTFNLDIQDNATGAPGPDGNIDSSGAWFINLGSLLTSRDNLRQAQADLSVLALNIPFIDLDGDQLGDLDGSNINFVGISLGSIAGIPFLAVEPTVNNGVLSVPGGGIANMLNGSQTFGPVIRAGLAAAGVEPNTPDFFQFLLIAQTVTDAADPINWGATTVQTNSVLLQQVAGDTVIPNFVPGAPLSGTEPLIAVMGLDPITGTTQDPLGIRGAVRLIQGTHGSLLDPSSAPAVTAEMQGQAASMVASGGAAVVIGNPSLILTD
ncbi:alpha/beta hydrolase [Wenzhouxiangella marina]|uniref:Extracellular lipase, Pla-1/cef family n=1 Tax=Wenzhouxiangella marina TaxID=1579979 RepID=A0A0K0XZ46_9GAMM|nr:Ig-like domain-containing protein [Wenzhouxiangella marina]AKS42959.1 Extracellular lipase, Pla-1/cef family [Wenzhouxiangella marina]MBB6087357.1 pimeloyl-ACP methyl ester carboxylesterase [Wenzhouxiangella marina]